MNWSYRAPTNAAQKVPDDWIYLCTLAFYRISQTVASEDIHPSLLVNLDQTGVLLNPTGDMYTYEEKGSKQVGLHGKDEKRAFTSLLSMTAEGDLLPSQSIWPGSKAQSLPSADVRKPLEELGHLFSLNPSDSKTHFSCFESMKEYFEGILVPHRFRMIQQHGLDKDAKCIVLLDCWAVHKSHDMLSWLFDTFPWIIIIFVPAGCTGTL